ncbi:MAG TPA: hypothetical protein VFW68_01765, partial [Rhodocyclaceae bacterium]|nr:hypothetical protein [Rhodocyclaceae bacterium]
MSTLTIADYLKYANLQMAAEAFIRNELTGELATTTDAIEAALKAGNNHASKFAASEATAFSEQWTVVDQKANTDTGFSGTLFRANHDNAALGIRKDDLVISFRSTEFIDDAVRDSAATNTLEVHDAGWAFGQIADMEQWYKELTSAAKDGKPAGVLYQNQNSISVTGYSLGGHLATAFNLLHKDDVLAAGNKAIKDVVTFNGAGVGSVKSGDTLQSVLAYFKTLREDPNAVKAALHLSTGELSSFYDTLHTNLGNGTWTAEQGKSALLALRPVDSSDPAQAAFDGATRPLQKALTDIAKLQAEASRIASYTSGGNPDTALKTVPAAKIESESLDYRLAVYLASQRTIGATIIGDAFQITDKKYGSPKLVNQTDVVGVETSDTAPWSAVSYSQLHYGTDVSVFIEDQPFTRGAFTETFVKGLIAKGEINLLQDKFDINNFADTHSLVLLVDSLNVQNLLTQLIPEGQKASAVPTLNAILKEASWLKAESVSGSQGKAEGNTLENVVNALGDLLLGPQYYDSSKLRLNGNPNGNTWWDTQNSTVGNTTYTGRDAFYARLNDIAGALTNSSLAGKLSLKAVIDPVLLNSANPPAAANTVTADQLRASAATDFTAFAALYSLSPLQVVAAKEEDKATLETALKGIWNTKGPLYDQWKADQSLTAQQRLGGAATFSSNWYEDRATQMKLWLKAGQQNVKSDTLTGVTDAGINNTEQLILEDKAGGKVLTVMSDFNLNGSIPTGKESRYISFGGNEADTLNGDKLADHLYGMDG